jgi:hypothetical protein
MADIERDERASVAKKHQRAEGAVDAAHLPRSGGEVEHAATATAAQARHEMIAARAYFHAEARGFACGCELNDWLRAESEIDARITGAQSHAETTARNPASERERGGHGPATTGSKARQVVDATEHRARGAGLSSGSVLAAKSGLS